MWGNQGEVPKPVETTTTGTSAACTPLGAASGRHADGLVAESRQHPGTSATGLKIIPVCGWRHVREYRAVTLGAELRERGVELHVIDQGIDTATAEGRAMFGMLSVSPNSNVS